jgi:ComF family protein
MMSAVEMRRLAGQGVRKGLDALFPPLCPINKTAVARPGFLSAEAWDQLHWLSEPWCARCGLPFETPALPESLCAKCLSDERPVLDALRAPLAYDDVSRSLILRFKHGDAHDQVARFAQWMARAGRDLFSEDMVMVPVPLHARRLRKRGFNQSALLARALAKRTGCRVSLDALVRGRPTPTQGGLSFAQRRRNVAGAFMVRPRYRDVVAGRSIVLVDDVWTTGATMEACGRVLRRAGAQRVSAVVVLRRL